MHANNASLHSAIPNQARSRSQRPNEVPCADGLKDGFSDCRVDVRQKDAMPHDPDVALAQAAEAVKALEQGARPWRGDEDPVVPSVGARHPHRPTFTRNVAEAGN